MKTTLMALATIFATSMARAQETKCTDTAACLPENVLISIYGTNMGPKQIDYDHVRNKIGSLVADMKIRKFVLQAIGVEGGFTACLVPLEGVNSIMKEMMPIEVDRTKTSYEIRFVDQCDAN